MASQYQRFDNENEAAPPPYNAAGTGGYPAANVQGQGYPAAQQGYPQASATDGKSSSSENQYGHNQPPMYGNPGIPPQQYGPVAGQSTQYPAGQAGYPPNTPVVVTVVGNCPNCRVGNFHDSFNICGIILAILFFPIGLLCMLCLMDKKCSHCGFIAG